MPKYYERLTSRNHELYASNYLLDSLEFKTICKKIARELRFIPKSGTVSDSGLIGVSSLGINIIPTHLDDVLTSGELGYKFVPTNRLKAFPIKLANFAYRAVVGVYNYVDHVDGTNVYLYVTLMSREDGNVFVQIYQDDFV